MHECKDDVSIRPFCPDSDAIEVCNIWVKGLEQTVRSKWWPLQPLWRLFFNIMAEQAVKSNGDVGPNGENLYIHWCKDSNDRTMLVAEKRQNEEDEKVTKLVGCIAIVRGTNPNGNITADKDETTFSVWKMSVSEDHRRAGIGSKLLEEGENWARCHGCIKMRMITANPIASVFYQKHGYEIRSANLFGTLFGAWHEKDL